MKNDNACRCAMMVSMNLNEISAPSLQNIRWNCQQFRFYFSQPFLVQGYQRINYWLFTKNLRLLNYYYFCEGCKLPLKNLSTHVI